jgi:hypothetical protein
MYKQEDKREENVYHQIDPGNECIAHEHGS